ncbi:hypothetical protein BDA99DRAFT_502002 [Phascolomyces articulosus]|uniref:Uncharacterized protein n=1 Tax=Phascolomyces articulosus TaxID=60185 RepID=A0AAD5KFK2_9FUNG|nr:hypothetical protein BDA99DRAFT_502002 [Phascolomyces articulosus]
MFGRNLRILAIIIMLLIDRQLDGGFWLRCIYSFFSNCYFGVFIAIYRLRYYSHTNRQVALTFFTSSIILKK